MRTFTEYLTESIKQYPFKIKFLGEITSSQETQVKAALEKYQVASFKKLGTTPVQSLPLDFPNSKNTEVTIYEVTLDYPVTGFELRGYLCGALAMREDMLVVRRHGEPSEEYQEPNEPRTGALLNDPLYKESPKVDSNDYYGDTYNANLLKSLNDTLTTQRKEREKEIPTASNNTQRNGK